MIKAIMSLILVILFFFSGSIVQSIKRILALFTELILKLLNFFGIRIRNKEETIKLSNEFKESYKEIKKVKLSKKNLRLNSSIDWLSLSLLLISILLVLINYACNKVISDWISNILAFTHISKEDTAIFFTSILFSVISFTLVRVMNRWKETKRDRQERKEIKLKKKAIELMTSKELLDSAKEKDREDYKELK